MKSTSCIPDNQLRQLMLGELTEQESLPLEQHLLACPSCVARTRSLRTADTLVSALAGGMADPDIAPSGAIDRLVHRLSDRSHLATHRSLSDETHTLAAKSAAGDVSDLVARFEPPAAAGELGRLGGFRVLKLLGQGGMGAVFLAEDSQLRRPVALKLMRPRHAAQPGAAERFLREARAAAAVKHDHVVTIYQVGEAQGLPFIAEELLEGETLEDRLKREQVIPIDEAVRIGREIAVGLAAAHARGLLHRDVKPSNVWLEGHESGDRSQGSGDRTREAGDRSRESGDRSIKAATTRSASRTKLLDFGLARQLHADEQLTESGAIVGTPAYMSPEQAQGSELDARSDVFSLGGVLYRMVTGRLPFPGADVLSILRSLAVDDPPPARSLNKDVPAELSEFIAALLRKDRQQRPSSAAAVVARFAEFESAQGKTQSSRKTSSPVYRWIALAVAAAIIALAVFLTVKTPYGEVTVELGDGVKPGDVQIEVRGNHEVKIADAKHGWTIDVREGQYQVHLAANTDRFEINERTITVSRKRQTRVKVTVKPQMAATDIRRPSGNAPRGRLSEPPRPVAPFTAEKAKAHQRAWADHLDVPVEWENSIGMKFVLIPPGEFTMGMPKEEINAALLVLRGSEAAWIERVQGSGPEHRVNLTQPIYLGVHEVTQSQYREVTGLSPSFFAATGEQPDKVALVAGADTARNPVEGVTWNDAAAFCGKLSERERLPPRYALSGESVTLLTGHGYQLPTEATWEFACRAGTQTKYYSGSREEDLAHVGWYGKNSSQRPHPVGKLPANAFGLRDMHGNVMEWCQDGWDADRYQESGTGAALDPATPPTGTRRTTRGGGWGNFSSVCASGLRSEAVPHRSVIIGFRVALPVAAVKQLVAERARSHGLEFNGRDSYVELPGLHHDGSRPITIEAWATPGSSRERGYSFVLDNVDDSFVDGQYWPAGIGLQQRAPANGAPNCWGAWVSTQTQPHGQNQIVGPPEQWAIQRSAHLALQLNNDQAQLYVNGQLAENWQLDALHRASDKHFVIGNRFAGRIREVRVSKISRYADRFTPETRFAPDDDTLALYHCDEGAGDVLTDSSGHEHHGRIVNAQWQP